MQINWAYLFKSFNLLRLIYLTLLLCDICNVLELDQLIESVAASRWARGESTEAMTSETVQYLTTYIHN